MASGGWRMYRDRYPGALLAFVYVLGGRQLAPCVWAHMLINLAIEPWLIISAISAGAGGWRSSDGVEAA